MNAQKETLKQIQQRCNEAYMKQWQPNEQDPAYVIQRIGRHLLEDSEQRMKRMMQYHRIQFLSNQPLPSMHTAPLHTLLQLHLSDAFSSAFLARSTPLYLQSEEELVPIQTEEDIALQHVSLQAILAYRPSTGALIKEDITAPISLFHFQGKDLQEFSLCFTLPDIFAQLHTPSFQLQINGMNEGDREALLQILCHAQMRWQISFQGKTAAPLRCEVADGMLHIQLPFDFPLEGGKPKVCLSYQQHYDLPCLYLRDMQIFLPDQRFSLASVMVNAAAENPESFSMFDAPLSLFQMCYLRCDEVFARRGSMLDWTFTLEEHCILQGEELLEKEEYHMFMRRMPRNPITYDVYCEQVQLEYYNGEWVRIREALLRKEDLTQLHREVHLRFLCPKDILPYSYEGEQAFWFRFVLTKAENCYQIPSRHHIPILRHSRISYTYQKQGFATENLYVSANHEQRYLSDVKKGLPLWITRDEQEDSLFLCLKDTEPRSPLRVYVEMRQQLEMHYDLSFSYMVDALHAKSLDVEDNTDGFAHSGMISLFLPDDIKPLTLFQESGLWIRIRKLDQEPFYNTLDHLYWNSVGAIASAYDVQTKIVSLDEEQQEQLIDEDIIKVEVLEQNSWIEWQLCEKANGERMLTKTSQGLRIERRWLPHEMQLQQAITLRMTVRHIQKARTYPKGSVVLPAKANARIHSITTIRDSIQNAQEETDEHLLQHISYAISHGSAFASTVEMEQQLLYHFLELQDVRCERSVSSARRLSIYTLWKCQDEERFVHNEELRRYMESQYPFDRYVIHIQVRSVQLVYCEITLELEEEDMDVDNAITEYLRNYFHPFYGGTVGQGWKIDELPKENEVLRDVKKQFPQIRISSMRLRGLLCNGLTKHLTKLGQIPRGGYQITYGNTIILHRKESV